MSVVAYGRRFPGLSLAAILFVIAPHAAAQFVEDSLTSASFFAENDVLQIHPSRRDEDRNYTGGFGFQFSGSFVRNTGLDKPLRGLDRLTRFSRRHDETPRSHTLLVFGTAFTPDDLNTAAPVRDDRPYASLLGVSVRRLSFNEQSEAAWSSELAIAALGLPVARNLQTWVHRRLRANSGREAPYDPLGWHNQISDGGEPTALYRVGYERLLIGDPSGPGNRKHVQLTGGLGASAGYFTNVNAVVNARLGWFTSDFWEFTPSAMNVGAEAAPADAFDAAAVRPRRPWELFVFAGARPRLHLYNALLQGQFRDSAHTVDIKRGTVEWDLGAAVYIPRIHLQVVWNMLAGRTPEFEGGTPRTHTWGALIATYVVR